MTTQQNSVLIRRLWEEVVNAHNLERARELCIPDYVHHDPALPGTDIHGLDNYLQTISAFFTALPDIHVTVHDLISEGDKVVSRWTFRGTHQAALMGIPATGKQVAVGAISVHRLNGGKIVEGWVNFDTLGLLQQLGAVSMPG